MMDLRRERRPSRTVLMEGRDERERPPMGEKSGFAAPELSRAAMRRNESPDRLPGRIYFNPFLERERHQEAERVKEMRLAACPWEKHGLYKFLKGLWDGFLEGIDKVIKKWNDIVDGWIENEPEERYHKPLNRLRFPYLGKRRKIHT